MNPGYLFLLMALFFGASKGFCGKKISGAVHGVRPALAFNALRMAFCVLIGLVILLITGETLAASGRMLGIAALNGVSTAVSVVSWVLAVQYSAYTMLDVFLMLGTMVPAAGGALFLGEVIAPRQLIGLAVLIGAVGLMCGYSSRAKRKLTLRDLPLLLLAGLAGGLCAFTQKLFRYYCAGESVLTFNFYTYAAAFLTLALIYVAAKRGSLRPTADETPSRRTLAYLVVMALCLFLFSYAQTAAAAYLPAIVLYPMQQGLGLIVANGMAALLFGEKPAWQSVAGSVLAFAAMMLMRV